MQIHVAGLAGPLCTLNLEVGATVAELKGRIARHAGIAVHSQRLFHGELELTDVQSGTLHLASAGTLHLASAEAEGGQEHTELLLVRRTSKEARWAGWEAELVEKQTRRAERQAAWLRELNNIGQDEVVSWLRAAPKAARVNREVAMLAVQKHWRAIEQVHLGIAHEDRREVVLTALRGQAHQHQVNQRDCRFRLARRSRWVDELQASICAPINHSVFQYAGFDLRADRDVVLAAVELDGLALEFAASHLRADREVAWAAMRQHSGAYHFIDPRLKCAGCACGCACGYACGCACCAGCARRLRRLFCCLLLFTALMFGVVIASTWAGESLRLSGTAAGAPRPPALAVDVRGRSIRGRAGAFLG